MLDLGAMFGALGTTQVRNRLLALIRDKPGSHASELARSTGDPWSTVQYHLDLLSKGDMVTTIDAGRTKRFFPAGTDERKARLMAIMNEGRRQEIVELIRSEPGLRQVDLCKEIEVSRKTFRNAIGPLVDEGLVHERRTLQDNRYFPTDDLDAYFDL